MDVTEAIVRRVWDETPRLKGVVLEVSSETARAYQRAGQFVEVQFSDGEAAMLAIASSPGEARALELLVGGPAREREVWSEGRVLPVRGPQGLGFPLSGAEGQDILLFAQGSALAALRPVVDSVRRRRAQYGTVRLYVGARTEADFPYVAEYPGWQSDGVEIVRSVSRPWVQERFREAPGSLENTVAFVCGMQQMMDDVAAVLVAAGLPADRIGRNL